MKIKLMLSSMCPFKKIGYNLYCNLIHLEGYTIYNIENYKEKTRLELTQRVNKKIKIYLDTKYWVEICNYNYFFTD